MQILKEAMILIVDGGEDDKREAQMKLTSSNISSAATSRIWRNA
jgi:hypothetical protein